MPKTFRRKRLVCQTDCKDDIEEARIIGRKELVSLVNKYMIENSDLKEQVTKLTNMQNDIVKGTSRITQKMYEYKKALEAKKTPTRKRTPTPRAKTPTPKAKTPTPKAKTPTPKTKTRTPGKTVRRTPRSTPTATRKIRVIKAFAGVF